MQITNQLLRFGVTGCLATATHVVVFYGAHAGLGSHPTLATTLAFCCAVGVSYGMNRTWTFQAAGSHARHLPRFLTIALACAALNAGIMHVGVEALGWSPTFCLLVIILTLPALSFVLQRSWGFR